MDKDPGNLPDWTGITGCMARAGPKARDSAGGKGFRGSPAWAALGLGLEVQGDGGLRTWEDEVSLCYRGPGLGA